MSVRRLVVFHGTCWIDLQDYPFLRLLAFLVRFYGVLSNLARAQFHHGRPFVKEVNAASVNDVIHIRHYVFLQHQCNHGLELFPVADTAADEQVDGIRS